MLDPTLHSGRVNTAIANISYCLVMPWLCTQMETQQAAIDIGLLPRDLWQRIAGYMPGADLLRCLRVVSVAGRCMVEFSAVRLVYLQGPQPFALPACLRNSLCALRHLATLDLHHATRGLASEDTLLLLGLKCLRALHCSMRTTSLAPLAGLTAL